MIPEEAPLYREYDKPAAIRNAQAKDATVSADGGYNEEILDIPAFLRRQAD